MSGGWGMAQLALHTITENASGLSVNLPFEVHATIERDGAEIHATQSVWTGSYEMVQTLQIENRSGRELEVKIRLPYWCAEPTARADGMPCAVSRQGGFMPVTCPANAARSIELHLPMHLQVIPAGRNVLTKNEKSPAGDAIEQGLQYGPYVLMLNRMMYPEITQKDISVTIPRDSEGHPIVRQAYPVGWPVHHGAVPFFVEATVQEGTPVLLTPCANMTMTKLTVDDPYILRFASITGLE
jgi:DUF1680 family protein